MTTPSHRVTEDSDKVVIHDLELFMAYDPSIDNGGADSELLDFDNARVKRIVAATQKFMERGSLPRLVVMHERDGSEPKSAVGRFTKIGYQERGGIGYIVGDCEVPRKVFDAMIANNAFPRRSAEIYKDIDHLAAVALLGREAPRRPLPDTHFAATEDPALFSRKFDADFAGVGGGTNTFIPATEDNTMPQDMTQMMEQMCSGIEEIKKMCRTFAETAGKATMSQDAEDKEEMSGDEVEMGEGEAAEMGELTVKHEGEEEAPMSRRSSRHSRSTKIDGNDLVLENARLKARFARFESELRRERFSRAVADLQQDGYQIREDQVDTLVQQLERSDDPAGLIDTWRELFARDPIGRRIDMSRGAMPKGDIDAKDISALVREHAGKPEAFAAAVNARLGARR
jgi:hypothetical protein